MNEPTMTQLFKEMDDVWGRFSKHIETITAKPDYPPRPTDEQLLEWGVRILGDEPRRPKRGECRVTSNGEAVMVSHASPNTQRYNGLRWIVEDAPPQGTWVECEVWDSHGQYVFDAYAINPMRMVTPVSDAPSIKGFGGFYYPDVEWNMSIRFKETDGRSVVRKPDSVRFWVTEGGE